jgi:hypothetical protein
MLALLGGLASQVLPSLIPTAISGIKSLFSSDTAKEAMGSITKGLSNAGMNILKGAGSALGDVAKNFGTDVLDSVVSNTSSFLSNKQNLGGALGNIGRDIYQSGYQSLGNAGDMTNKMIRRQLNDYSKEIKGLLGKRNMLPLEGPPLRKRLDIEAEEEEQYMDEDK